MLLVWLFNIEGTLDLIAAISLATLYDAAWPRPLDSAVLELVLALSCHGMLTHCHMSGNDARYGRL
jgi:hypothetical protein